MNNIPFTRIDFPVSTYEPPPLISFICKSLYYTSSVLIKLHRVERRYTHPYLYIAGVITHLYQGDDSRFLGCVVKIIRISRIIHDMTNIFLNITNKSYRLLSILLQPPSEPLLSYSYNWSCNRSMRWRPIHANFPSASYMNRPMMMQLVHRLEIAGELLVKIIFETFTLITACIELSQTFHTFEQEYIDDIYLEIEELLKMYDASNPEALYKKLEALLPSIEFGLKAVGAPFSSQAIIDTLEAIVSAYMTTKNSLQEIHKVAEKTAKRTVHIAKAAIGT